MTCALQIACAVLRLLLLVVCALIYVMHHIFQGDPSCRVPSCTHHNEEPSRHETLSTISC